MNIYSFKERTYIGRYHGHMFESAVGLGLEVRQADEAEAGAADWRFVDVDPAVTHTHCLSLTRVICFTF